MTRRMPALVAALGAVLVVVGVVVFVAANRPGAPRDFGWAAYRPLEPQVAYRSELTLDFDDRWSVLWTGGSVIGAALVVAGLLVLGVVGGWWLGRRSSARG